LSSAFINLSVKMKGKTTYINTDGYGVDENYISVFGIPLLAGRNFIADDRKDVVILTRFGAERLNFKNPADAIGAKIIAGPQDTDWHEFEIIGVTENVKTTGFYRSASNSEAETGRGMAFLYGNKTFSNFVPESIVVKLRNGNLQNAVAAVEKQFLTIFSNNVFSAVFLDSQIQNTYYAEALARNQLTFFTLLAIAIACLGLLGMISNKIVEKKKEIGIRKALGAGIKNISSVLLGTTVRHMVVAMVIAIPMAYYLSDQYLQRFTERIPIAWWHFLLPVILLLSMMVVTISYALSRAILTNPVDSLRDQ
jgi:putative ABC transport system permease protein